MGRKLLHIIALSAVVLLSQAAGAQHYIGAKAGYGGAQGRFYPPRETRFFWNCYTGGIAWKYYSEKPVIGAVAAEIEYQQRGYHTLMAGVWTDSTAYTSHFRTVNSVTVPLIWQPHLYFFDRKLRIFINAGVTFSFNTGIGDRLTEVVQTVDLNGNVTSTSTTTDYTFITARDNRVNYGICGGFGAGVLFGRFEIFAEARYYYGMSDIIRNKTKYIFQQDFLRSELDNFFVYVGMYFRLGKGGIKAPPLRLNDPDRRRASDKSDFRNIKLKF